MQLVKVDLTKFVDSINPLRNKIAFGHHHQITRCVASSDGLLMTEVEIKIK